jgi:hypothetical protein
MATSPLVYLIGSNMIKFKLILSLAGLIEMSNLKMMLPLRLRGANIYCMQKALHNCYIAFNPFIHKMSQ